MRSLVLVLALALLFLAVGCRTVSTVRLQPDAVEVGPGLRPIAGIQANAISAYFLFIPIPGVNLDTAVNQILIATAKTMGADKITNLTFEVTPEGGFWAWRKLLGWRSAQASGIAVQVTAPAPDPDADQGPEPAGDAEPEADPAPPSKPAPSR